MDLKIKEKRAIVCGSTQGIGRAIALELALLGASVTLVARNEEKLKKVAEQLPADKGQQHDYVVADFDEPKKLKKAIDSYLAQEQNVHILINNTGGPAGGKIIDAKLDEFHAAFNRHLICNQILIQAVTPLMKQVGYGRIINIISTSVKAPLPGLGVSNTIRGAVASWAKTLATELAPYGITVNNVLPGATSTARLESIIRSKAEKTDITEEDVMKAMKKEIPAGRFATPEEVAAAAAFLATPAAAYINGINLPVDGGRLDCL
ncbi:3-oxoacyl-[acyl-carrier protein] reductase [Fulvivirga imtechensis AK7]|uniref:3-oxoacyl-[acyl-carrier protein] reductase n=1 Tax=Fulvivirga imtechensis AK7 TaxID=1237149 RepID=L8JQ12_9BACT|nr:SDR family oxidoreductase [Fulvivirga imtechensis]ELR70935.1 3-oxoacyl-[acyl-carrier protein] reductase [Fulvivirga imtechensis AK7]